MTEWCKFPEFSPPKGQEILVFSGRIYMATTWNGETFYERNENRVGYVTHWMPLPEPPKKDGQKEDAVSKVTREIMNKHHEIIDDWCKAYMAQIYQEKGSIKPGDFILNCQQLAPTEKFGVYTNKYWFTLKEDQ